MSLRAVGRMILAPAAVAAAAGILLRPLGPAALPLAFATFFAAQLAVHAQSQRQLDAVKRRLAASRRRRQRLRGRP
ncbi:MAG TPA: hypothetical protein VF025_14215 [Gaiellaceae bacterium]